MPNKVTRKIQSFEGVAAGQTATARIATNLTLNKVLLAYSGVTLAQMNAIRLVLNGKTVQQWSEAAKLDLDNKYLGMDAAAGVLTIDMERFGLRTREGQEFTAIGMGIPEDPQRVTTAVIEVDIDAAAVGPVLSAKGIFSNPRPLGLIKHVREFTKSPGGAGLYEISDIPRLGDINRIIFDTSAVTINGIRIERDGYTIFERTTADNEVMQSNGVRVPQTGLWVVDLTEEGNGAESIEYGPGVKELTLYVDVAGGGQLPYSVEYIGPLVN